MQEELCTPKTRASCHVRNCKRTRMPEPHQLVRCRRQPEVSPVRLKHGVTVYEMLHSFLNAPAESEGFLKCVLKDLCPILL